MTRSERDERRLAELRPTTRADVEAYAAARLGTMLADPRIRAGIEQRLQSAWEPYAAVEMATHEAYHRMFEDLLARIGPMGTILDLGCGPGSFRNFGRTYADVPNPVVAVDRVRPESAFPAHVRFVHTDLLAFEWHGPTFDAALALHVFEQVPDTPRLAAKLRGLLHAGATALLAIPDGRAVHDLLKFHWWGEGCDEVNVYTRERFDALMQVAGFRRERWSAWPSYFSVHYGHIPLPNGDTLGALLDRLAADFDRLHGTTWFSCYGYALEYVAV
jgi:SAM-dependent methyltransferase